MFDWVNISAQVVPLRIKCERNNLWFMTSFANFFARIML
jgi:hypothetical protein